MPSYAWANLAPLKHGAAINDRSCRALRPQQPLSPGTLLIGLAKVSGLDALRRHLISRDAGTQLAA